MAQPSGDREQKLEAALIDLAVESWRLHRLLARVLTRLDAGEAKRYSGQLRYFQKKMEEQMDQAGLTIVNLEGQRFDPGVAASPVNIADFDPNDELLVDQMLEPIVMGPDGLKKEGTILLRKAHV